jgi:malate dehydrogenase (oxaloacetate-decarboxylating)
VVISGAGAAGVACAKILLAAGIGDLAVADSRGIVHSGRSDLTPVKAELASLTNRSGLTGSMADALAGADVFVGVSAGRVDEISVAQMAPKAIIFALANPTPEVAPDVAHRHAAVVATGRSDYPNQINNVLAFPGIFAGAFDAGARAITENMKLAAARALGEVVAGELAPDKIVPTPFDPRVAPAVAAAVAEQAVADGVAG